MSSAYYFHLFVVGIVILAKYIHSFIGKAYNIFRHMTYFVQSIHFHCLWLSAYLCTCKILQKEILFLKIYLFGQNVTSFHSFNDSHLNLDCDMTRWTSVKFFTLYICILVKLVMPDRFFFFNICSSFGIYLIQQFFFSQRKHCSNSIKFLQWLVNIVHNSS